MPEHTFTVEAERDLGDGKTTATKKLPPRITRSPAAVGLDEIPEEVREHCLESLRRLNRRLTRALDAETKRRAQEEHERAPTARIAELTQPYLWNLALYGPIQIPVANPVFDANKVIQEGQLALMIGISFAPKYTVPQSNMYLAAKNYRARFSLLNVTTARPGPDNVNIVNVSSNVLSGGSPWVFDQNLQQISPLGQFSTSEIHYFLWLFSAAGVTTNTEGDLYDCNFDVDISFPNVPGGGFASWHYDADAEIGIPAIGLPGIGPGWRYGYSARFMINKFPG